MKKAIGYIRVSTEEQAREGVSLAMQEEKIRLYCQTYEIELVEIIRDEGFSAKTIKGRPGCMRLLDMCDAGGVDAIVVYKLDRLVRNTREALGIVERLNRKSASLISITEHLDTQSALGRLYFSFTSSIGQFERELIGERTKAALDHKKANGQASNHPPYGMDNVNGNLQLNFMEQENIEYIRKLLAGGKSYRSICNTLNEKGIPSKTGKKWSHAAILKICGRMGNAPV